MSKNLPSFRQMILHQYVISLAILVFLLLLYLLRLLFYRWWSDPRSFSNLVISFDGWVIVLMINAVVIFWRWYKTDHLFKTGQVVPGKIIKFKSKWLNTRIEYAFSYKGRACQGVMDLYPTKSIKANLETPIDIVFEPGNPYQSSVYDLHVGG